MLLLTGFGLGCLALVAALVWRDLRQVPVAQVFLLILVAGLAFLIDPLMPGQWRWLTSDLQTAAPGLFWLLCQLAFSHRPRIISPWGFMALYSFVAPALTRPFGAPDELVPWAAFVGWKLGQYFEYLVVAHGLWTIIHHWRDDLVEARRRARLATLLILGGAVGVAVVSLNTGTYGPYTRSLIVSATALLSAWLLLGARPDILRPATEPAAITAPNPRAADPDAEALAQLMRTGYYRTEKLTLNKLASAAQLPEYRVRRVINQQLGYRNFNDYINQLRIAEAAQRLQQAPDEPILNISLDVGYRSLSSFNRAFRDIMGATPTDYRQRHIAPPTP